MTNAIAVWDRTEKTWTYDCPHCGQTNCVDLRSEEIPDEVDEPREKLLAQVKCCRCEGPSVVFFALSSRLRKRK